MMTTKPDAAEQSTCSCVLSDFLCALGLAEGSAALVSTEPAPETAATSSPALAAAADDPLAIFDAAPPAPPAAAARPSKRRSSGFKAVDDYLSVFD